MNEISNYNFENNGLCIRANMGTGKSKLINDILNNDDMDILKEYEIYKKYYEKYNKYKYMNKINYDSIKNYYKQPTYFDYSIFSISNLNNYKDYSFNEFKKLYLLHSVKLINKNNSQDIINIIKDYIKKINIIVNNKTLNKINDILDIFSYIKEIEYIIIIINKFNELHPENYFLKKTYSENFKMLENKELILELIKYYINFTEENYILNTNKVKEISNVCIENNLFYIFKTDKKDIKKYIERNNLYISDEYLSNNFIIKHNEKLGLIIFKNKFTNNDRVMYLYFLHFEINSCYLDFLNFLFKYYTEIIKITDKNINNFLFKIIKKSNLTYISNVKDNYIIIYNNSLTSLTKYEIENNFEKIGYLYIIKEREFHNKNESVYKIGCTTDIIRRFKQYPKNSILIYSILNENHREIEKKWLKQLNNNSKIKKREDIGREYFECNYKILIDELRNIIDFG